MSQLRPEPLSKITEAVGVGLDGDHPSTGLKKGGCDRSMACPYVDDQAAGMDTGVSDEALRPPGVESCHPHGRGETTDADHHDYAHGREA